jgi:uncharacterized protein (DUF1697 family)
MTRYVAFLRAINVGGRVVRMSELKALCASIPLANVSTFIASGNVIFDSAKPREQVERVIERKLEAALGYKVSTMARSRDELAAIVERVDAGALDLHGTLYVGLLKDAPPAAAAKAVVAMSNPVDVLSIDGAELFWQCRASFSESTIVAARVEKTLGRPMTVRNYNTVRKLAARV